MSSDISIDKWLDMSELVCLSEDVHQIFTTSERTNKQSIQLSNTLQHAKLASHKDNEAKAALRVEEKTRRHAMHYELLIVVVPENTHEVSR